MKGQVLDVSIQSNSGVISGADGKRYPFSGAGWNAPTPPRVGMQVDFETDGESATGIYAARTEAPASAVPPRATTQRSTAPPAGRPASVLRPAPAVVSAPMRAPAPAPVADPEQARRAGTLGTIGLVIGIAALFLFWIPVLGWGLMMAGLGMSMAGWVTAKQHGGSVVLPIIGTVVNAIPVAIHTALGVLLVLLWKIVTETIGTFLPFLKWMPFL